MRSLLIAVLLINAAGAQAPAALKSAPADLRAVLLELAHDFDPAAEVGPARAALDVYALELKERLAGRKGAKAVLDTIADYFFSERGFGAASDLCAPDAFYLDRMIASKQGVCLSLTALILAATRRLELPLHAVAAPRHVFLRYDDGKERLNFETLEAGRARPDSWYKGRGIAQAALDDGVYLKNLSEVELVAHLLNNDGFIRFVRGRRDEADRRFVEALKLRPNFAEARINRGVCAADGGDMTAADQWFREAARYLKDDHALAHNRALAALREDRLEDAKQLIDAALEGLGAEPGQDAARHSLTALVRRPATWNRIQSFAIAANAKATLKPGLRGAYYDNHDFAAAVFERIDAAINFEWYRGTPDRRVRSGRFAARWNGLVRVPSDGEYRVFAVVDGGVRVWIDGVRLIDNGKNNRGGLERAVVELIAGVHDLRVDYTAFGGTAGCIVSIQDAARASDLDARHFFHR